MRFQYRHPRVYDFFSWFVYPKRLMSRFREEVGQNNSVFDVAAGYGRIVDFIDPTNSYSGIDLNEIFVRYGQKHGRNVVLGDILEKKSYKPSDIFILVDIVHHLSKEKLETLFDLVFEHAQKKVVILEPTFGRLGGRHGAFGKFADWFMKTMDYDGFNRITRWFTADEYTKLFDSRFGSAHGKYFSVRYEIIKNHYLITLTRRT